MNMKWYFAYGSNMDSVQLGQRIKRHDVEWKMGWLPGYTLKFDKLGSDGSGYASIGPEVSEIVYGVLYLLSEEELRELDRWEGVPEHYVRKTVEVETRDGKVCAECYFPNKNKIQIGLKPRRDYLDRLVKGAQEHNLPLDYIAKLRSIEALERKE